jgi:parvulin-like peptidyl-prolyl isomerase
LISDPHPPTAWAKRLAAAAMLLAATGCRTATPPVAALIPPPSASGGPPPTTAPSAVVATVNGVDVTRDQLDRVLYQSYGINLLADLLELGLAKQVLEKSGQTLTDADVAAERQRWFAETFASAEPADYDRYYRQLKSEKHLTDAEFDLGFATTATLRKLAKPQVAGRITDAQVKQAFGILYGENRQIMDIAVLNVAEAGEVHARLAKGYPIEAVFNEMNTDPKLRESHGELIFSNQTPGVPRAVVDAAFALQHVNDVSQDVISDGKRCHVIKLMNVIPPKVVKFEDVKADVRRQLEAEAEKQVIAAYRDRLRQVTLSQLRIDEPTLRKSWDDMIAAQLPKGDTVSKDRATGQIDRAYHPPATGPATAPAPATGPAVVGH